MARTRLQIPLESKSGDKVSYVSPRERRQLLDAGLAEVISERNAPERLKMTDDIRPCGINRGVASHTGGHDGMASRWHSVPHYPIPYAYEGHLTMPRARLINAVKGGKCQ